ncbi:MAG: hypothetical protein K2H53_06950 [Clostridia bacterium]|nr:hypothetical protein [Clostridia bacterium]
MIIMQGNIKRGIVIPLIRPYLERASSQELECLSRLNGIKSCFKVERPERIYDVTATGSAILKILCKYPSFCIDLTKYLLLSTKYSIYVITNSKIEETVIANIK